MRKIIKVTDELKKIKVSLFGYETSEWFLVMVGKNKVKPEELLKIENVEARRSLIALYGIDKFIGELIKQGKAELVLEPVNKDDYQYGRLWQIIIEEQGFKYLEVINRTIEPGADKMTKKQRLEAGLTEDGYARYFLGVDPSVNYDTIWDAWCSLGHYKKQKGRTIKNKKEAYAALLHTNLKNFKDNITLDEVQQALSNYEVEMDEA